MIRKQSLLRELNKDRRPVYTCNTLFEQLIEDIANSLDKALARRKMFESKWLHNYEQITGKTMRIVRYNKMELPTYDTKAK